MHDSERRPILHDFGSLWFAAVTLILFAFAMGAATIFEVEHGTEMTLARFYRSWWFLALLGIIALSSMSSVISRIPFRRRELGFVFTHGGLFVVAVGAIVTFQFGISGRVAVSEGQTVTEFQVDDSEALEVAVGGDREVVDLSDTIGGLEKIEEKGGIRRIELAEVTIDLLSYHPDSELKTVLREGGADSRGAIEAVLSHGDHVHATPVFMGQSTMIGELGIGFRRIDADELAKITNPKPAEETARQGPRVTITVGEESFELPATVADERHPLGRTGLEARVLRYMPHATVAERGGMTNVSNKAINPYVEVEITGPAGRALKKAFAKFPDFAASHEGDPMPEVKLLLTVPLDDDSRPPIEVLAGPDGSLMARFTGESGLPDVIEEIEVGKAVATPWSDFRFLIERRLDRAEIGAELRPISPPRAQRRAGMVMQVEVAGASRRLSMQKYDRKNIVVGGKALQLMWSGSSRPLGFSLTLDRFHIGNYPGTGRPRSFESHVTVVEPAVGRKQSTVISMNNPATFGDYELFQSSYDVSQGRKTTILSVSNDPGLPIVFLGYFIVMGGMLFVMVLRMTDAKRREKMRQDLLGGTKSAGLIPILFLLGSFLCGAGLAQEPARNVDYDRIRDVVVQHDGRWMPMDTLARDVVHEVTGSMSFRDLDPVAVLLAWTFDPVRWQDERLIPIESEDLRSELGLDAEHSAFAFSGLLLHEKLRPMMDAVSRIEGRKLDSLEQKVAELRSKLLLMQRIFSNGMINAVPHPEDVLGAWRPIPLPEQRVDESLHTTRDAWGSVRGALQEDDAAAFAKAVDELKRALGSLPSAWTVDRQRIETELTFNRTRPFTTAWIVMSIGAILSLVAMVVRRRPVDILAIAVLMVGFGILTWGMALRWTIAGRIPASNMFESLLFLSWGMGAFSILAVFVMKHRLVPLTASFLSALSLCLADILPVDAFVRPIAPVLLDTYWMSIHVPIIMVSYSVLTFAVLVAHVQLAVLAFAPARRQLAEKLDHMHYWYVHVGTVLLTIGIVTGSMWAASSWGRYWGWDPKEVWSLVACLGYLTILHVRMDHTLRRPLWLKALGGLVALGIVGLTIREISPLSAMGWLGVLGAGLTMVFMIFAKGNFANSTKSVICFWLVIMTYLGVNYVLGTGLHSYGFGTGAMVRSMMIAGLIDLGFIVVCGLAYLLRRGSIATPLIPVRSGA